jgi:hypothetical protein
MVKKLATVSGEFYVGMTKKDVKSPNSMSSFNKIDKNGDGKLSDKEICDARDLECYNKKTTGALFIGGGICTAAVSLSSSIPTVGLSVSLVGAAIGELLTGARNLTKGFSEQNKTDDYRKQHKIYTEM